MKTKPFNLEEAKAGKPVVFLVERPEGEKMLSSELMPFTIQTPHFPLCFKYQNEIGTWHGDTAKEGIDQYTEDVANHPQK